MPNLILPSILSANMMRLNEEIDAVVKAGADMIHFDVMDNHYVPNLTFGPVMCQHLKKYNSSIAIDVHLMATPVDELITQFAHAGATRISIHTDATLHLNKSLSLIKELDCQVGIALNPADSIERLRWCAHQLDFVLIMTVNPGFGGQKLLEDIIPKITEIKKTYPHLPVCVDGGINENNIATLARAGASQFVAGSAIFNSDNYTNTIATMRNKLQQKI